MPYTPVELRHVRIGRALFGYSRSTTDDLLEEVASSFEDVWRERGELADTVEELEKQLAEIRQREHLLASTLIAAEKAAAEAKDQAKREAELIIAEAHQEGRSIMRGAQAERERLFAEARRVETLLRSALGLVEESAQAPQVPQVPAPAAVDIAPVADPAPAAGSDPEPIGAWEPGPADAESAADPWPNREDTSEFPSLVPSDLESRVDDEEEA